MYTSKFFSLCARHDPSWWKCLKPSWRLNCRSRGISFSIAKLAITDLTEITIVIEIFNSSMNVLKAHELANEQANGTSGRRASEFLAGERTNQQTGGPLGSHDKTKVLIEILLPQHKKEVSMTNERPNERTHARPNEGTSQHEPAKRKNDLIFGNYAL